MAEMTNEEFREYVNAMEPWTEKARGALNDLDLIIKKLVEKNAPQSLIDAATTHLETVIAGYKAPYRLPVPEVAEDKGDLDGEPTRQDILDRRAKRVADEEEARA